MRTRASCLVRALALSSLVFALGLSLTLPGALSQVTDDGAATYFRRAATLDQQGKLDQAEREYLLGLKIAPNTPDAQNNLAVIYFKRKKFDQAVEAFQHAHELQPDNPEFSFNLGLALFQEGHSAAAIPHLIAGAAAPDHVTDAHFLLGASYFNLKLWQRSSSELELARRQRPDGAEILFLLVKAYGKAGKPKESLDAAAELLKSHPDSSLVHELLGEAHDIASQPRDAEDEFKAAVVASPEAPQLHFLLGYIYWRWKRYGEAIAPFEEEVRINPNFAPAYFYLGDSLLKQGKPEQAMSHFRKALQLDTSYGEACLGMGEAYVKLGRPQDAIPLFRNAAQLLPERVEPHHWLGRTLIQVGRPEEGRKELTKVERINSTRNRQATQFLSSGAAPAQVGEPAPHR